MKKIIGIILITLTVTVSGLIFQGTGPYGVNPNVKDFGAFGDGVHDDRAAIQAAIDGVALMSGNSSGTVYLPAGVFKITNTVFLSSGIIFKGNGVGSTVISNTSMTADSIGVKWTGNPGAIRDDYTVSDMTIKGQYHATAGVGLNLSSPDIDGTSRAILPNIHDIDIVNHYRGMFLSNIVSGKIENVHLDRTSQAAIVQQGACTTLALNHVYALEAGLVGFEDQWTNAHGFYFQNAYNITLNNCSSEGIKGTPFYFTNCSASSINECNTETFTDSGISLIDCKNITLQNFHAADASATNGIVIMSGSGIRLIAPFAYTLEKTLFLTNSLSNTNMPADVSVLGIGSKSAITAYQFEVNRPDLVNIRMTGASTVWTNALYNHWQNLVAYNPNGGPTGTKKITLPVESPWEQIEVRISGYDYNANYGWWEAVIGAHVQQTTWSGSTVKLRGKPPFETVRLGYEGTHPVILLGETNTAWHYTAFAVTDFYNTEGDPQGWESGWTIVNDTTETGITDIVTPIIQRQANRYYGAGAPGTTPSVVGDVYVDTTGKKVYFSTGTASSADWTITN